MPAFPVSSTTFPMPDRLSGGQVFYALRLLDMDGWKVRETPGGLSFSPYPGGIGSFLPWSATLFDPAYMGM